MNAALSRPAPASRVPSIPPVPAGLTPALAAAWPAVPPPVRRFPPPSPRVLAERAAGEAAAVLAAEEHCLAGAHELVADAERTHTRPITMRRRGVDVVLIPGKPFSAERMAERRAYALARVAECEGRVAAADLALAEARWVLRRLDAEAAAGASS